MSSADGAALHYPFHLGWFALHERARLQPGDGRGGDVAFDAVGGETGTIRTAIGRSLTFDEIPEALESMERRETVGRLVVTL